MSDIRKQIIDEVNERLDSYHEFEDTCRRDDPDDATHIILDDDDRLVVKRGRKQIDYTEFSVDDWMHPNDPRHK